MVLAERDSGQCDKGLSSGNPVPGVSCDHLGTVSGAADQELAGGVFETADEVDLVRASGDGALEELLDGLCGSHFVERRGEDDAFPLLEFGLEISGRHQVLVSVISACDVLEVLEVVVPVGSGHELRIGLVGLEIEPGE